MSNKQVKFAHYVESLFDKASGRYMPGDVYKVISVKNSVEFAPGQLLDKAQVAEVIAGGKWEVVVVGLSEGGKR